MSDANPESSSQPYRPEIRTIKIGRLQIALNVILQVLAVLTLVIMANFLAFRHHRSIDLSTNRAFTLSPQTKAVMKQLQEPCKAIVYFFNTGTSIFDDTKNLLKEYETQSNRKIVVEVVDRADAARARELQTKYKFYDQEDIVILDYKGKSKWVEARDFAELEEIPVDRRSDSGPAARVKNYKGEQYITSALMELVEEKQNMVYLIAGHGELVAGSPDFKISTQFLERQNYKIKNLPLSTVDKIPADASAVMICGPGHDYSDRDLQLLDEYWKRNGRIFVALGPDVNADKLTGWLGARGVNLMGDRVIAVSSKILEDKNTVSQVRDAEGVFTNGSPITKPLANVGVSFFGQTQSITPVETMVRSGEVTLSVLAVSPPQWWGETESYDENNFPRFDPKKDHQGPLALAVAVEKGAAKDPKVQLETPRLVVVGNGICFSDSGLRLGPLHRDFLINSLNWLLGRETLLELPAKDKPLNDIALTDESIVRFGLIIILGVPCGIGMLGLYYLWWRHGRNLLMLTLILCVVAGTLWVSMEILHRWALTPAAETNTSP